MNSIKKQIKTFFKSPKDIIGLFLPIIIAIILILPVPYTVTIGGGTMNIDKKISIKEQYEAKGSFNCAYVKEMNGTVITYLLAKIIPSYELNKIEDITYENEEKEDYDFREKMYFTNSLDTATKVVFDYLNKPITINDENIYIVHIDEKAITDLETGDMILEVENIKIDNTKALEEIVKQYSYKEEINVKVLRNNKEIITKTKLIEINNEKKLGVYLMSKYSYETAPKVNFNFSNKEAGPSGGLMLSLSIYNKLTEYDITHGLKIVGTGTIESDGSVGEIGGIKYKLKGAVKDNADILIVPNANYEEAKSIKEEKGYNIKVISVGTFKEAIEKLEALK